ncbi:hypothetical protein C4578_00760 [Candidatus Microgenomates bacterium]|jgi:hypothetical protein|nr:MAG: hypothetical protein C4578_00760 [Candidatus Microgenomates bacterium]
MQKNSIVVTIIVALIVGVAAFYGGMQYQQRQKASFGGRQFTTGVPNGQFQARGNLQGIRPINGEIISQDENSITVKMQDGSSKIVILSDQTAINKASTGSKDDLKTGEQVAAFGTENSDGSITAQNISIGETFRVRQ